MSVCTFFGHRDCPETIRPAIVSAVEALIVEQKVDTFYVGSQGRFDACVRGVLRQLREKYPHVDYAVVLPRLPGPGRAGESLEDTVFPEALEGVHPRYALDRRNRWMVSRADYVVCYVRHTWGGAWRYTQLAQKQKKTVIKL